MTDASSSQMIFHGNAAPDMRRCASDAVPAAQIIQHQRTALGKYLENVPVGCFHSVEHPIYKLAWHVLMEEVAHRIHKHHPRRSPTERLG